MSTNPFDPFASAPPPSSDPTPAPAPTNPFGPDWQQSALAVMSNGTNVWKKHANLSLRSNMNPPSTQGHSSSKPKRIVPYEGPIATLQSQWDPHLHIISSPSTSLDGSHGWKKNGNFMIYLIVRANEMCIPPGGVESVLKWNKLARGGVEGMDPCLVSSLSLKDGDVDEDNFVGGTTNVGYAANSTAIVNSIAAETTTASRKATGGGGLNFLKSGLKKAQGAIERSVTTIAIRADGGKNRDWVCISLHYRAHLHSQKSNDAMAAAMDTNDIHDVCLSRTEWVQLPPAEAEQGIDFSIPLCVPDLGFLDASNDVGGARLTIRMYIRSGAALLNIVKREYPIGECIVQYSNIVLMATGKTQQPNGNNMLYSSSVNVPITMGMLAETTSTQAALKITATQRIKFSQPCTLGWNLTDPVSTDPSMTKNWLKMFQLPLDQAYVFPILNHHQLLTAHGLNHPSPSSSALLMANERAVESTLVLPIATAVSRLLAEAAMQSSKIASIAAGRASRRESIRCYSIPADDALKADAIAEAALKDGCADVEIGVVALILENGAVGPPVPAMMTYQRCDSIFEETLVDAFPLPVLDKASGESLMKSPTFKEAVTKRFCPKVYTGILETDGGDSLLPGVLGTSSNGYVGSVRLSVTSPAARLGSADPSLGIAGCAAAIETIVPLEPYLDPNAQRQEKIPVLAAACDGSTGNRLGTFLCCLRVKTRLVQNRPVEAVPDARSGLIAMIGLNTLTGDFGMSYLLDNSAASTANATTGIRQRQVSTMGSFLSSNFLKYQAQQRAKDASFLKDRFEKYNASVNSGLSPGVMTDDEVDIPLFKRRTPRPFRPSNSRQDELLAGIGFNVHVQSMALHLLQDGHHGISAAVCTSVTHGAPADHARGFGVYGNDDNESGSSITAPARGGLRRLESTRLEFAREVDDNITGLINAVGEFFNLRASANAAKQQAGMKNSRYVPPNIQACNFYRNRVIESMHKLHSLTWEVALRRVNCFSQVLGIAVTSYLSSISDGGPAWRFANIWATHGYLITFEGLLSAVGKELGMIEDASIAVEMLKMVSIVLTPAGKGGVDGLAGQRITVPYSSFVRSICLNANVISAKTQYRLEVELDPSYFENRVPVPLKGTAVRFVPVLFQMGVDIRQWGANAGRSVTTQIKDRTRGSGGAMSDLDVGEDFEVNPETKAGLIDDGDEDDDTGPADTEILVALNLEGFHKLNQYAHLINPTSTTIPSVSAMCPDQGQTLPTHPLLSVLCDTIKASAGRMEHGVLDHAASVCQRLGGGSTVFCKSGKDRTAMQVTFKQAQFLQRFMGKKDVSSSLEDATLPSDLIFATSALMRIHGTRVPICEKNAGEAKYAFNPLQAKFMPDALKPPPVALAGFLKKPET
eukprot:CCRYP_000621-RA/>CCRYP_000621-RA protein AED:0.03 eAED:0.03 QI:138/1/1/1/1/1/6/399/1381